MGLVVRVPMFGTNGVVSERPYVLIHFDLILGIELVVQLIKSSSLCDSTFTARSATIFSCSALLSPPIPSASIAHDRKVTALSAPSRPTATPEPPPHDLGKRRSSCAAPLLIPIENHANRIAPRGAEVHDHDREGVSGAGSRSAAWRCARADRSPGRTPRCRPRRCRRATSPGARRPPRWRCGPDGPWTRSA